jgi:CRP/FNR family transcriptional regulator
MRASLKRGLLERYPALRTLPDAEVERLLDEGAVRELPAGTVIFDEAQPCMGFPFVLAGSIGISKLSDAGREIELYRVGAGDSCILSSSCLLGNVDYNARATALEDVRVFILPRPTFERLMSMSDPFRRYVFQLFAERMGSLMQTVEAVAFRKLDQRLASLLLSRGPHVRATHQQLADELGSVREIVTRLVRSLADRGLVRTGREHIEVLDAEGLRRFASGAG